MSFHKITVTDVIFRCYLKCPQCGRSDRYYIIVSLKYPYDETCNICGSQFGVQLNAKEFNQTQVRVVKAVSNGLNDSKGN